MFDKDHLDVYLRAKWQELGHTLAEGQRMGVPITELVERSRERNSNIVLPYLDLWVSILDECISWQISLVTIFYAERKHAPMTDFDKSVISMLMKIVADSTAMRHLILLGFDTAARTLLRSTAEYMELLVAIIDQPQLAAEFAAADSPEASKKFWENHLARGGIRKKMRLAWQKFFSDAQDGAAEWFADWGNGWNKILSAMIHPSYMSGVFTAIPAKQKYEEENWLGIWGDKSDGSVDTIYIYVAFMFPLLLLHHEFPFEGFGASMGGGNVTYDETNEFHKHVKIGRGVLSSLILSLGHDQNGPHVFPDIDMSIWPAD